MKRLLALFGTFGLLLGSVFGVSSVAYAQESSVMDDAHIERIRTNCVDAQTKLTRLHTADALLRVNRGQLYEQILTKLMSPFNSRVALNNLNSAELVSIAATYQTQLMEFRSTYQQYEESLSEALKVNCTNQPVAFYDKVAIARDKRKKVHDSTSKLKQSIETYRSSFNAFRASFLEKDS
jgi:hypothetical protein